MSFGIRIAPGVRLSASSRGLRMGVGPRIARLHVGGGRTGLSTGFGPFSYYTSLGGRRRARRGVSLHHPAPGHGGGTRGGGWAAGPGRAEIAAAERQARRERAEQDNVNLAADEERLTTLHLEEFPLTVPPPNDMPPPVDRAAVLAWLEERELHGVGRFDLGARREARRHAAALLESTVVAEEQRRLTEHQAQRQAERVAYEALIANDPGAVLDALEAAFADNESPAVAIDVDGATVSLVVLFGTVENVPEYRPDRTPTGQPRKVKRTKSDRNDLYVRWLAGTVLATVKEAFAVAPGLQEATVVVIRRDPAATDPALVIAPIYAGSFTRVRLTGWNWSQIDPPEQILLTPDANFTRRGAAREVAPLDLREETELAEVADTVRDVLLTGDGDLDADDFQPTSASPREPGLDEAPPAAPESPQVAIAPPTGFGTTLAKGGNTGLPNEPIRVQATTIASGVDISAVLLGPDHRSIDDSALVFYNQPQLLQGAVQHQAGTNPIVGGIRLDLPRLPAEIHTVAITLSLDGTGPSSFGALADLHLLVGNDRSNTAITSFEPTGLTSETALIAVEVYRRDNGWKVRAVGQGYADGLAGLATDLGIAVE
jgi:stress response protein SCP2